MAAYLHSVAYLPQEKSAGGKFVVQEPDTSPWLDVKQARRMSRLIKMSAVSAKMALKHANLVSPDMIVAGTGWGCMEDTGIFLDKLIAQKEEALNPTPFMQSTHNTLASQVALLTQCLGYNQTYTHDGISFESALADAMLLVDEHPGKSVLVGGMDEITALIEALQSKFHLFDIATQGENACWMVISSNPSAVRLVDVELMDTLVVGEVEARTHIFLEKHGLLPGNPGANSMDVLVGTSGHPATDGALHHWKAMATIPFKASCGEFPTATAYAVATAFETLQTEASPRKILIANSYFGMHHSLILLEKSE